MNNQQDVGQVLSKAALGNGFADDFMGGLKSIDPSWLYWHKDSTPLVISKLKDHPVIDFEQVRRVVEESPCLCISDEILDELYSDFLTKKLDD